MTANAATETTFQLKCALCSTTFPVAVTGDDEGVNEAVKHTAAEHAGDPRLGDTKPIILETILANGEVIR